LGDGIGEAGNNAGRSCFKGLFNPGVGAGDEDEALFTGELGERPVVLELVATLFQGDDGHAITGGGDGLEREAVTGPLRIVVKDERQTDGLGDAHEELRDVLALRGEVPRWKQGYCGDPKVARVTAEFSR